ncbi:hypothetical protein Acr_09g0007210 [Actinidia rufa]|uniref:Reverse transcriptase zinc-binding domain-containing protein n=1 Tax=Actinidia rufa TaxID=165716 RepID=A0A7J0F6F6_9ERIC|nr:hypothetical protein Acr_09g0007210 [Actinidia rufa]
MSLSMTMVSLPVIKPHPQQTNFTFFPECAEHNASFDEDGCDLMVHAPVRFAGVVMNPANDGLWDHILGSGLPEKKRRWISGKYQVRRRLEKDELHGVAVTNYKNRNRERLREETGEEVNRVGLKINFHKCSRSGVRVPESALKDFAGVQYTELQFRRALFAWEHEEVDRLRDFLLRALNSSHSAADQISWEADNSGCFSVKSIRNLYSNSRDPIDVVLQQCWDSITPPRFHFLAWLSYLGRLKIVDRLLSMGIFQNPSESLCKFCDLEVESGDHILLSCHRAWSIWCDILSIGALSGLHNSVKALFHWSFGRKFKKEKNLLWRAFSFAILQTLWEMRNKLIFEGKETAMEVWVEVQEGKEIYREVFCLQFCKHYGR